jgi:hypothetical protein
VLKGCARVRVTMVAAVQPSSQGVTVTTIAFEAGVLLPAAT